MAQILPPEIWLEVLDWATHNSLLDVTQSHSPFQTVPLRDNIRDPNMNVRLTVSLVCRQWRQWIVRSLYSDIKIKDHSGASDLRSALEKPITASPAGYYGETVRRVVLHYNSTVPGPHTQPMQSVEVLKLCPYIHTLLRPPYPQEDGLHFNYETLGVSLPALRRLEWWFNVAAERSGGINSLGAVLHGAPNIFYLFVDGVIGFGRLWVQKQTLPRLQILRLGTINGLFLNQITSCWSMPSLTHLVLDFPLPDSSWGLICDAFGHQLKVIELGKHVRFLANDSLSFCLNGCPGIKELNFYLCFTFPAYPNTIQLHNNLTTVRLHSAVNGLLPGETTIWHIIDHHFELLSGSNLPALRRIILYGDWESILHHPRFIPIRDKLQDIDRVLELSH